MGAIRTIAGVLFVLLAVLLFVGAPLAFGLREICKDPAICEAVKIFGGFIGKLLAWLVGSAVLGWVGLLFLGETKDAQKTP